MGTIEQQALSVIRLNSTDAEASDVIDVLCEAFYDYPVMRFVLGSTGSYGERLQTMVGMFVTARTLGNDPMFGVRDASNLVAAMTTSNPAEPPHPDLSKVRADAWQSLGADAEERYAMCVRAWESIALHRQQLHVNMIGVRGAYRGKGLARWLLDEVHAMCDRSTFAEGVSLTTEVPQNVEFYRHLGYQVVGEARVADVLPVWSLFRLR